MTDETASPRSILFVDDDEIVRNSLKRMLCDMSGWRLNFASSGEDAIGLLEAFAYDAIITDYDMPGMNGLTLLEQIRSRPGLEAIPVVMLTGNADQDLKRRALDAGATDLLGKPIDQDDLIARIRSVLRLKSFQDQLEGQNTRLEEQVAERTRELERSRIELIWRLGKAGEFRDSETGHHVVRVGYFTLEMARQLGLDRQFCLRLFLSSPLHDVGKIGIPDAILLKPGKLEATEWQVMKQHTTIGAAILEREMFDSQRLELLGDAFQLPTGEQGERDNPLIRMSANIARSHHERWDGHGYPNGISGEEIPLEARITTVADVYDALCSRRPYKPPFPESQMLEIMRNGAGTRFDPEVMAAFEKVRDSLRDIRARFSDEDDRRSVMDIQLPEMALA